MPWIRKSPWHSYYVCFPYKNKTDGELIHLPSVFVGARTRLSNIPAPSL